VSVAAPRRLTKVWAALVVATLASVSLSVERTPSATLLASVTFLVVALIKVRLVGQYFMELRHAPRLLSRLFDAWCLVVGALMTGVLLLS
jgi:caa(3)-type oxidase subunit IV